VVSTTRNIVKRFLNRNFEYDPDYHLRTASRADRTRKTRDVTMDEKLENNPKLYQYMRDNILLGYNMMTQGAEALKKSVMALDGGDPEDAKGILQKKYIAMQSLSDDMKKIAEPLSAADTVEAWNVSPPVDVFHHFTRYMNNHYEDLRKVCGEYYNEHPDFEYAIIYYDTFGSLEDAREFKIQHESEFKCEVLTIENSGITLVGPFKENRERIDFYNKNTEILKRMDEQLASDHKLGKDLMEKHLKDKKKKNIAEMGPDDKGLAAYSANVNTVKELGAKKSMTLKEQREYHKALQEKEDAEVPDDALKVEMFFPEDADGTTSLKKSVFYTQVEAPLHLQDCSEFAGKYQPVATAPIDKSIVEKSVVNRYGQSCSIKTLKASVADKK
jgi:hypothetical protein